MEEVRLQKFCYLKIYSYSTVSDLLKIAAMSKPMSKLLDENKHKYFMLKGWNRRSVHLSLD